MEKQREKDFARIENSTLSYGKRSVSTRFLYWQTRESTVGYLLGCPIKVMFRKWWGSILGAGISGGKQDSGPIANL